MKSLLQWLFRKPPAPAAPDDQIGVRIISGPVQCVIDGKTYAWTPAMEEAVKRYNAKKRAAEADLASAKAAFRDAMKAAVKDLTTAQPPEQGGEAT